MCSLYVARTRNLFATAGVVSTMVGVRRCAGLVTLDAATANPGRDVVLIPAGEYAFESGLE
jgi:hypothetical protein